MPFQSLTSDSLSITCLLFEHDWNTELTASHFFPADIAEGLSGRESRRPEAEALLLTLGVQIWAEEADAQALRQALATLGAGWVGVPILADQFVGRDYSTTGARIYSAQRLINLTTPAIVAAGSTLNDEDTYAPLVVGHITELPTIEPQSGALALCALTFTEDSPWTFRVGVNAALAATVFPPELLPDWSSPPTQQPVHGLSFDRIGRGREQSISGVERDLVWTTQANFTLTDKTEVATLLAFFLATRGAWGSFAAPLWFTPGTATDDAPHATIVRFTEQTLKLTFTTSQVATAQVGFTQVPWEITGTAGETPQQPARIFLYQVTYALRDPQIYRYTNCWRPLTRTENGSPVTYDPKPWEHESIDGGLDLSNEKITLHSFIFAGNPLDLFNPNVLEGRMWLRIYEVTGDPLDPDAAALVWFGSIAAAPQTGRKYSADCQWLGGIVDQEIPNVRVGPMCNTYFLSRPCGHKRSDWVQAGTLTVNGALLPTPIGMIDVACADASLANLYAPGKLEVGSGAAFESRMITASAPITGGQRFTLDRPLRQAATGQAVAYYRTCDRSVAACQALDPTGWKARFRGHPNLSQVALSLPSQNSAPAGKK